MRTYEKAVLMFIMAWMFAIFLGGLSVMMETSKWLGLRLEDVGAGLVLCLITTAAIVGVGYISLHVFTVAFTELELLASRLTRRLCPRQR